MDFIDKIMQFAKRADALKDSLYTEEATKTALIMPFFQLLGYDIFDPNEFVPEFTADIGIKKGEKCDYAILRNGSPIILIEAKWVKDSLDKHVSQLFRYFVATEARFAVLTNGISYRFYTDLEEINKMDELPFLEINLLDIKKTQIDVLENFQKDVFNIKEIFHAALELKYFDKIKRIFLQDLQNPSDELVKYFLSYIYDEPNYKQGSIEKLRPIIKQSLNSLISEICNIKTESIRENGISSLSDNRQSTFYVLNTNMQYNKKCDEDMLKEQKAAAYGGACKYITKLKRGDTVFLYRNRVGIVAYGVADGELKTKSFTINGESCDEYYMHLDKFQKLKIPLSAAQMKKLSSSLAFQLTMYKIEKESGISFISEIGKCCLQPA